MNPLRLFVPILCIALLVACTSQQRASTSERDGTGAQVGLAPTATPQASPSAVSGVTPAPTHVAAPVAAPAASAPPAPAAVVAPVASVSPHARGDADTQGLFMTHCAACHGATGDGNGTTKLDRPARSFKDGGFSYGNTPDAIAKTLAYGIPGSVMPSFGKALSDEQRIALAKYVIELGPQDMPTESPDRVMVVSDRAVVARGKLPPIAEGGEEIPRGLLVGTPDGFTFAYRTDDLRLIAVYQGEFAERTDWMGRGGTQLKPLGKLVAEFGDAGGSMFEIPFEFGANAARSIPLQARAKSTRTDGARVIVGYDLMQPEAQAPLITVEETTSGATTTVGSGWRRHFRLTNGGETAVTVQLNQPLDLAKLGVTELGAERTDTITISGGALAKSASRAGGPVLLRSWRCTTTRTNTGNGECVASVEPRSTLEFELLTVIAPIWNETVQKAWEKEVLR